MNRPYYLLLASLVFTLNMFSQEPLVIKKTQEEIVIDGILSEKTWKELPPYRFTELSPAWGVSDSLTVMYVTFDEKNLYIGFQALEPEPEKVINRSLLRDKWYGDDYVSFHIDPNITGEKGFIFSVFPASSRIDLAVSNNAIPLGNATFNGSYDMIWKGQTHFDETGWTAEFEIPISNLRFKKNEDGQVMGGISGLRSQNHLNKLATFPSLPQNIPNVVEMPSMKVPAIFEGLEPRKQLQITPYAISSVNRTNRLENEAYQESTDTDFDAGLDVRYGISSDLTLDLTLNTDFAQVEIDDQVVNINDRVNIFLPEKRKFFQEQAGLFDFNAGILSQLFYSRRIGINNGRLTPIIGGARLTGSIGKTDIGVLSLQTEGIGLDDGESLASENFGVLRLKRKVINQRSFLGFMATNRIRKGYYNTALGMDGVISFPNDLFLISSASTTFEKDGPNYDLADNSRVSLFLDKRKRDGWIYRAAYEFSGDQYNPEMGFLLREKHHNFFGTLGTGKINNDRTQGLFQYSRWTFFNPDIYFTTNFSHVITGYSRTSWTGRLFNGDSFGFFAQGQYENVGSELQFSNELSVPEGEYTFAYFGVSYNPGVQRDIQFPISVEYGKFFDGTNFRFNFNPVFNFGKHMNIETSYRANRIAFNDRDQKDWIHIGEAKLNWALNLHLSGSFIGQYNSISEKFLSSARVRYNFSDGHDLYFVYNQDYNLDRDLQTPQLPAFNDQVFTIKYLYTFFR
ncbi:DUF5916 domain-containing protein [Aureisphaera galaxeae]|uniref:DUF5916 domain-containing protein n=1 Tax=Aureisphaera galaxeae TaxID=1538023 RepID=UPI0023507706|nr:DUF5916 domain-containing protein [Aureisphaera galaxeae]MDC8002916.1 DUF5916 domain-containing protein [Aureisphaera galaxeae]